MTDKWTKEITTYESLLVLQTDHPVMGKQGQVLFVSDVPTNISTGQVTYVIADPILIGDAVCSGANRFVATEMELLTFFQLSEMDVETYLQKREQAKEDAKEDGIDISRIESVYLD
ncbi:hypothetical protein [Bacillus thuringiensis]|uniref:hypothetical protein n=1 Tax=Bacillus thuringiensis TaxID=1428 RepID=UPI001145334E|nr:hypothetical protein [Bacillus thuringiensis]